MRRSKGKSADRSDTASSSLSPPPALPSEPDRPSEPSHNGPPSSEPPHAWRKPLPPDWMTRGGFQLTDKTNARGPLYHDSGWQWDQLAGQFVHARLSQQILAKRALFRANNKYYKKRNRRLLHGEGTTDGAQDGNGKGNASEASEGGEDSDDDSALVPAEHPTEIPSREGESTLTVPAGEGPQSQPPANTHTETSRPARMLDVQQDRQPAPHPKYIPVIEVLDSSDEEDEVVNSPAKRPRITLAGPSSSQRPRHEVITLVPTIASATGAGAMEATHGVFTEPDGILPTPPQTDPSTERPDPATTHCCATKDQDVVLLETQLTAMTGERDSALEQVKERDRTIEERDRTIEERDNMINHLLTQHNNLLKLYQNSVQMSSGQMGPGRGEL